MAKHSITIEFDDKVKSVKFKVDAVMDEFGTGLSTLIRNDNACLNNYKQLVTFFNAVYKAGTDQKSVEKYPKTLAETDAGTAEEQPSPGIS